MSQPWSQRFDSALHPTIAEFNASIQFDIALIEYDLTGSEAHAKMLAQCGIISPGEAEEIVQGLEQIRQEWQAGTWHPHITDPIGNEDVHFAVEKRLIELIGSGGKKLHTARSRNDQVATDLRLYLRAQIVDIQGLLRDWQKKLLTIAEQHLETLIPGYTHLQRAQPVSLAHHLLAYFEMAERDYQRLADVSKRVNICPLGSGALAGTTLPIDRHFTAELLGFAGVTNNSLDSVGDRDFVVEFLSSASLIMVHLSRLAEEIIIWSSHEFQFVQLCDRVSTGSSIMPQKKNPDVPELVRGKTGRVFGHLQGILTMLKGLPLAYNKDLQEDKEAIFDTVKTVKMCVSAMTIMLAEGITFQTQKLADAVTNDFANATDAADYLANKGVPFREAYNLVGNLVKICLQEGILLKDLTLERWRSCHPLFAEDIYTAIAPQQVVSARNSYGGTGFAQIRQQLEQAKTHLFSR